jgi:hypothetical protein
MHYKNPKDRNELLLYPNILRKKHKAQIEVDLYTTAYNLKRLINIENMEYLLQKVRKYNWKIA